MKENPFAAIEKMTQEALDNRLIVYERLRKCKNTLKNYIQSINEELEKMMEYKLN